MKWRTSRKYGSIGTEWLGKGRPPSAFDHLMDSMISGFAEESAYFFKFEEQHIFPFIYSELSVAPLYHSGIRAGGGAAMYQLPVKRVGSPQSKHPRADYWARIRNTTFLLEIKHQVPTVPLTESRLPSPVYDLWADGATQAEDIHQESIDQEKGWGPVWTGSVLSIPFVARGHEAKDGTAMTRSQGAGLAKRCLEEVASRYPRSAPMWMGIWLPNAKLVIPVDLEHKQGKETFPAVVFLAAANRKA